jgi:hypothetical protein
MQVDDYTHQGRIPAVVNDSWRGASFFSKSTFHYLLEPMMLLRVSSEITSPAIPRCAFATEPGSDVLLVALQINRPPLPVVVTSMARMSTV